MLLDLILLIAGGGMLYFGAEWLVSGAAGMAIRLGVRPLLIGLTVVSYATSAPELAVSVSAALKNQSELALGNVVGSNIANIGLILGLTAFISRPKSDGSLAKKELVVLLLATAALPFFLLDGSIGQFEGAACLLGALGFTWLTIRWSKSRPVDLDEVPEGEKRSLGILSLIGLAGLAVLVIGGELFVRSSSNIALSLGVSPRVVGLTIVAFGTSLPELAASMVAALRGHGEMAIGNVIGSNIFNLLLILGVASSLSPIHIPLETILLDLGFLVGLTLFAIAALAPRRQLSRFEGIILGSSYFSFLGLLAYQAT